jgi:uncharacterized protein involved in exopolysaccharide biosynthesis
LLQDGAGDGPTALETGMTHPQITDLRRQIEETEQRIARLGEPVNREHLLLLFSLERELKEWRRRLSLLLQQAQRA